MILGVWTFICVVAVFFPALEPGLPPEAGFRGWLFVAIPVLLWKAIAFTVRQSRELKQKRQDDHLIKIAQEQAKKAKEEEKRAARKQLENNVMYAIIRASGIQTKIPEVLAKSMAALESAKGSFSENLYYPFWDEIEEAAKLLQKYHQLLSDLDSARQDYLLSSAKFGGAVPNFPVTGKFTANLTGAQNVAEEIKRVVRRAHQEPQFSSIYAARMTNEILKSGFSNLIRAVDGVSMEIGQMTNQLDSSLKSLERQQKLSGERLAEHSSRIENQAAEAVFSGKTIVNLNRESAERETRMVEMLDNIQRGKKPPTTWL